MLLFDEPKNAILSEAKAIDNKVDNLKKIIDEAAKAMESESQGPSEPTHERSTFQGEGSSTPKKPDLPTHHQLLIMEVQLRRRILNLKLKLFRHSRGRIIIQMMKMFNHNMKKK